MKENFLPKGVIQACFTTISLTYHLFWKKENKYKVEKYHIYNTMTAIYTIIDSKKKKNTYKTILLEDCTIKQRKIKLKFKENQKIT